MVIVASTKLIIGENDVVCTAPKVGSFACRRCFTGQRMGWDEVVAGKITVIAAAWKV